MTHTKKKPYLHGIIIPIIVVVIGFYGGIAYQSSKSDNKNISNGGFDRQAMMNLSAEERSAMFEGQAGDINHTVGAGMMRGGEGMTVGKILETSNTTITVDLGDEGSQLVLISDKTVISKPAEVTIDELEAGDDIFVDGETNDDGSIIADTIQVRMGQEAKDPKTK